MPRVLHGLDRDVYQIIRKLEDDHERNSPSKPLKFTVSGVYDSIKRSNSSLARQKKRPLEDSIERVLRLRKEERKEEDEEEDLEEASAESPKTKVIILLLLPLFSRFISSSGHWILELTCIGTRLLRHEQKHHQVLEHTQSSAHSTI